MQVEDLPFAKDYLRRCSWAGLPDATSFTTLPTKLAPEPHARDSFYVSQDGRSVSCGGPSQLHPGTKPSCDVRESPQIFFTRSDAGFSTSPPYCELYYFEASILSLNQSGIVGVGLEAHSYPALAYMNNGACYSRFPLPEMMFLKYGESYTAGDTIGCGFQRRNGAVFFTKNGNVLPRLPPLSSHPHVRAIPPLVTTIVGVSHIHPGICTSNNSAPVSMRVNFGQDPFVFDICTYCTTVYPPSTIFRRGAMILPMEVISAIVRHVIEDTSVVQYGWQSNDYRGRTAVSQRVLHRLSSTCRDWRRKCRSPLFQNIELRHLGELAKTSTLVLGLSPAESPSSYTEVLYTMSGSGRIIDHFGAPVMAGRGGPAYMHAALFELFLISPLPRALASLKEVIWDSVRGLDYVGSSPDPTYPSPALPPRVSSMIPSLCRQFHNLRVLRIRNRVFHAFSHLSRIACAIPNLTNLSLVAVKWETAESGNVGTNPQQHRGLDTPKHLAYLAIYENKPDACPAPEDYLTLFLASHIDTPRARRRTRTLLQTSLDRPVLLDRDTKAISKLIWNLQFSNPMISISYANSTANLHISQDSYNQLPWKVDIALRKSTSIFLDGERALDVLTDIKLVLRDVLLDDISPLISFLQDLEVALLSMSNFPRFTCRFCTSDILPRQRDNIWEEMRQIPSHMPKLAEAEVLVIEPPS